MLCYVVFKTTLLILFYIVTREMMISAHQNRIEELRESFKNKMAEMENWPMKVKVFPQK